MVYGYCDNCKHNVELSENSGNVKSTNKNSKFGLGTAMTGLGAALLGPVGLAIGIGGLLYSGKQLIKYEYMGKCPYCGEEIGLNKSK